MKLKEVIDSAQKVDDSWFNTGSFTTFKNPIPVTYNIADNSGEVSTLEGPVRYNAGDYIMTGPKGEQYPISQQKFELLYDDNHNNTATPKKIAKIAKLADHDGAIHTNWGDLNYTAGNDFIVQHGPNDYGVVKKEIFTKTYDISEIGHADTQR
jgi:hypothetical protein